jgi:hypothetical protein
MASKKIFSKFTGDETLFFYPLNEMTVDFNDL